MKTRLLKIAEPPVSRQGNLCDTENVKFPRPPQRHRWRKHLSPISYSRRVHVRLAGSHLHAIDVRWSLCNTRNESSLACYRVLLTLYRRTSSYGVERANDKCLTVNLSETFLRGISKSFLEVKTSLAETFRERRKMNGPKEKDITDFFFPIWYPKKNLSSHGMTQDGMSE